jgi:Mn2+/Fe2+ NRAMP family transporter
MNSDGRRLLIAAMFVDTLGGGLLTPFELVYALKIAHLSLAGAGAVLSVAAAVGIAVGPLAGAAVDRVGPARIVAAANLLGVAGCLSLLLWTSGWGYGLGAFFLSANMRVFWAAFTPLVAGIAAAAELFGIPPVLAVPVMAVGVWLIVVRASYTVAERIFILLSTALLTYVGAAFLARPDWGEVARSLIAPSFSFESGYLVTFMTLVGTTITPYMLFYLQAALSDKGASADDYSRERADAVVGSLASDVIAAFIMVCTAATLFVAGISIDTADDAARALEPLAGAYARALFGLGLFGASMLAASVLPLSTAYAICGAFGWERTISRPWHEAPIFNGLYTVLIVLAALFVLVPGLPLIQVILATQTLNGVLLPIILVFVTRLASDSTLLGERANGRGFNVLAWGTTAVLSVLTAALLVLSLLGT